MKDLEEMFIVICETCGKPFDIESEDNAIFPCEVCGNGCCEACFQKKHGKAYLKAMLNKGSFWACDKCFPMYKHEIFAK